MLSDSCIREGNEKVLRHDLRGIEARRVVEGVNEKFGVKEVVVVHELNGDVRSLSKEEVYVVSKLFIEVARSDHASSDLREGNKNEVSFVFFGLQSALTPVVDQVIESLSNVDSFYLTRHEAFISIIDRFVV